MRDILLLFFIIIASYFILKRPFIGVSLSVWTSLFSPNLWTFGFSQSLRINFTFLALTFISIAINQNRQLKDKIENRSPSNLLTGTILFFFLIGTFSTIFTDSYPDFVWKEWDYFYKTILLYFLIIITIKNDHQIKTLLWAIILSISFYGLIEALKFIVTGGGHQVSGVIGSKLGDRNAFSLALNICLPFILLMRKHTENILLKKILLILFISNVVAILGSYSRGGLIGLLLFFLCFLMKSKNKIILGSISTIFLITAISFMPASWTDRMDTIDTASKDESFIGRVIAWKEAILIANDHPFLGVGFKGGQNQTIWEFYRPDFNILNSIIDTSSFQDNKPLAAHSIYFQVLGDMGYLGLFTFCLILLLTYRNLHRVEKNSAANTFISDLSIATKNSLIIYSIAGAALSLPYFDISFILYAISTVTLKRIIVK